MNAILMTMYAKPVDIDAVSSSKHSGDWFESTNMPLNSANVIYRRLQAIAGVYFKERSSGYFERFGGSPFIMDLKRCGLIENGSSIWHLKITQAGRDYMRKHRINAAGRESLEMGVAA